MTYSPVVRPYLEQESRWRDFLDRHVPDAQLLSWSRENRVFRSGLRVMKIEWAAAANRDPRLNLKYEFSLLETLEGRALHLNPSYRVIDGTWHVLEMDWIEGEFLDVLIREGRARKGSFRQLMGRLFQVSLAGVVYKQLRPRHTVRRANGELVFIDFGGSSHANPLVALWRNFAPLSSTGGRWQTGRLVGVLHAMLRRGSSTTRPTPGARGFHNSASPAALRRWQANETRDAQNRPEHLATDLGDPVAARHFAEMERCLSDAIQIDPRICDDLNHLYVADYCIMGNRNWGYIWSNIADRVVFAGKRVIDLGCGMGAVGAFTRIAGSAHAISLDSMPLLLDAARHFAVALGIDDNAYRSLDWAKLANGSMDLPKADIISALSVRLADLPLERVIDVLAQYPEVLWQTDRVEEARRGLKTRGYRKIQTIARAEAGQQIIYAADRRGG